MSSGAPSPERGLPPPPSIPDLVTVNQRAILRRAHIDLRRLRHDCRGVTMIEMLVSMAILGIVVGALGTLLASGTSAEASLNVRFQAQTQARTALDVLRREVHNACSATVSGTGGTTVALRTLSGTSTCTVSSATWCIAGTGTRLRLFRQAGGACSAATGVRRADFLQPGSGFAVVTGTGLLPKLGIDLRVNPQPGDPDLQYRLQDQIVLRNGNRA